MNKDFFTKEQFLGEKGRISRKIKECNSISREDMEFIFLEINNRPLPTPALIISEADMSPTDQYNFASQIIKLSQKANDNNWDDVTGMVSKMINDFSKQKNAIKIMTDDEIVQYFTEGTPYISDEAKLKIKGAKAFRDSLLEQLNKTEMA